MSTADTPLRPAAPPHGAYQVHTDRAQVSRWHGGIVALHGVFALVVVGLIVVVSTWLSGPFSPSESALTTLPFVILLINQLFQIGYHCYVWGARAAIAVPLTLTAAGVEFSTARGPVRLPWEAVAAVSVRKRFFGRVMSLHPHPGVRVDSPGVQICYSARVWAQVVRRGLLLGERGVCEDLDQVVGAVVSASAGRVARPVIAPVIIASSG